ncbi:hypothetical protein CDL12_18176 [Handroanthus impetiginosus]|uniref:Transcription factor Iwr1 domain-containing protein n=1 Tax=Handroanthus impetiginosus TaxID=429701 RepID=A0A2G9GVB8_9LAMI|nr:hypothetical protein CDL12_18176 [Handroanthus impetiginosus]
MCRLYDVVRVDVEEHEVEVQTEKDTELDDCRMMAQYLPLLREVLPTAAIEVENDIHDCMSKQAPSDGYVYDFYAVKEDANVMEADFAGQIPLVQVDEDDDYYDGPDYSDYETDDSNAENNPLNDYPDEETCEDEAEVTSKSSEEESESESRTSRSQSEGELESGSQVSYGYGDSGPRDWSEDADFFEDELYFDRDDEQYWE